MDIRKKILSRFIFVYFVMTIFAVVIIYNIWQIQSDESIEYDILSKSIQKNIVLDANRGSIFSRDGKYLAVSLPFYEIRMDICSPPITDEVFSAKIDSLSAELSNLFKNKTAQEYKNYLKNARKKKQRYLLIRLDATHDELVKLRDFPLFRRGQFRGGLIIIENSKRVKPFVNLANRTIGEYKEEEEKTVVGIEGGYNNYLRGVNGIKMMQRISGNVWIPVSDENQIEPQNGKDINTTIDINIQDNLQKILLKHAKKHRAHHITAIIMEVKTGDILAIANLRKTRNSYREVYNYAIGESTEPGSTFKLASIMAVLEDTEIKLTDTVGTGNGETRYYGVSLKDDYGTGLGKITVKRAFELSSNVGISKIVSRNFFNKPDVFTNRLYRMHLNDKIGLKINGEGKPIIHTPNSGLWSHISLPWMSVGYGVSLTPLQLLNFYNAVANDGKMVKPRFVKSIKYLDKTIKEFPVIITSEAIASKKTIKKVQKLLEGVVNNGTAKNIKTENYKIAGKTGTVQIVKKGEGYYKNKHQASFAGYFPADKPLYSCIVVVNRPSAGEYYGGTVAAPIFREITDYLFKYSHKINKNEQKTNKNYKIKIKNGNTNDIKYLLENLRIKTNKNNDNQYTKVRWIGNKVKLENYETQWNKVPSVIGMGLKDAVNILENKGLKVKVKGRGKVNFQSISPNYYFKKGQLITIVLG